MKKSIVLSVVVATMFLGCSDNSSKNTEQTSVSKAKEQVAQSVKAVGEVAEQEVEKNIQTSSDAIKEVADSAKEIASNIKESSEEVVADALSSAKQSIDVASITKACVGCHGLNGEKNTMVSSGEGVPNTLSKDELKSALEGYASGGLNKFGKGVMMVSFAKNLTAEQIDAIAEAWGK